MSIKLQVKKSFCHLSGKVKAVDLHPEHPWVLSSLFSGVAQIYNYETQVTFWNDFAPLQQSCRPNLLRQLSNLLRHPTTTLGQGFSSQIGIGSP